MGLPEVGVEAVVKGLGQFIGDIGKMNSSLQSLNPTGNIITRTLDGISNGFKSFGESMLRVGEIALGVLVRDAFQAIVGGLADIIRSTIEAGQEFQTLTLRLNTFNLNTEHIHGNLSTFNAAMQEASELTKNQLQWIQRLAVTTPFDFQDIANVYTLARSYGFASEQAKGLTSDISDFAAGMGLGNTEIQRIIVNFGQMVQQGKVTSREMNDLARGAFVPVNDILSRMQDNVGLTGKAFDDFRNSGEGVQAFMEAFSQLVDERFSGSSVALARTFQGATDNAKDFVQSLLGFGVVTPILDKVGGAIADVIDQLTAPENWEALTIATGNVSDSLVGIVDGILGLAPSAEGLAGGIVNGLNSLSDWLSSHKDDIIGFFKDLRDTIINEVIPFITDKLIPAFADFGQGVGDVIKNDIVPFIQNNLIPAFQMISDWRDEYGGNIEQFFQALGEIVTTVIGNLTGMEIGTGGLQGFLDAITSFMGYVVENKDTIAEWVTWLIKAWGALQVIGFVLSLIIPPIVALIGFILGIIAVITSAIAIFQVVAAVIGFLLSPIGLLIIAIGLLIGVVVYLVNNWEWFTTTASQLWTIFVFYVKGLAETLWASLVETFNKIKDSIVEAVTNIKDSLIKHFTEAWNSIVEIWNNLVKDIKGGIERFKQSFLNVDWGEIGKNIINGIVDGVKNAAEGLYALAGEIAGNIADTFAAVLHIESPSKVFMGFGDNIMKGLAIGLQNATGMVTGVMQDAVSSITMPALSATAQVAGTVSTSNSYTNNYNLTVNSSSPVEPIVQDYNMLKSLAGV